MKKAVNFTVPFSYLAGHYQGIALLDGVTFALVDAPCGPARQLLKFGNCKSAPTGIFFDGVTAVSSDDFPVQGYLKLKPDA